VEVVALVSCNTLRKSPRKAGMKELLSAPLKHSWTHRWHLRFPPPICFANVSFAIPPKTDCGPVLGS